MERQRDRMEIPGDRVGRERDSMEIERGPHGESGGGDCMEKETSKDIASRGTV